MQGTNYSKLCVVCARTKQFFFERDFIFWGGRDAECGSYERKGDERGTGDAGLER